MHTDSRAHNANSLCGTQLKNKIKRPQLWANCTRTGSSPPNGHKIWQDASSRVPTKSNLCKGIQIQTCRLRKRCKKELFHAPYLSCRLSWFDIRFKIFLSKTYFCCVLKVKINSYLLLPRQSSFCRNKISRNIFSVIRYNLLKNL